MATNDTAKPPAAPATPPAASPLTDAERDELEALRAQVRAREEAEAQAKAAGPMDQTVPGGAYMVNDVLVNAEGKPITRDGKVKE